MAPSKKTPTDKVAPPVLIEGLYSLLLLAAGTLQILLLVYRLVIFHRLALV